MEVMKKPLRREGQATLRIRRKGLCWSPEPSLAGFHLLSWSLSSHPEVTALG